MEKQGTRLFASQVGATPNGQRLDAHLLHVALVVWRQTRQVQRMAYYPRGERINERECKHFARVAAFFAFVDCGGNSVQGVFNWSAHRRQLLKRTHYHMLQMLRRHDRTLDFDRMATRFRAEGAAVEQLCWNSWEQPLRNRNRSRLHNGYLPVADVRDNQVFDRCRLEYRPKVHDQERAADDQALQQLVMTLRTLPRRDFTLLERHYIMQEPQRTMALALHMSENAINVALHRARSKAHKLLIKNPVWQELARGL